MGEWFVNLYTLFFRFPVLVFRMDWSALGLALLVSAGAASVGVIGVVRQAVKLPPAEAMRPEPPADFKPSWLERLGLTKWFSPQFRMALRNIERRPWSAVFTIAGLALATGLMVLPGSMSDSIDYLLTYQWNMAQRQDVVVFLTEAGSPKAYHDLEHLPGVITAEPLRSVQARIRYGPHARKLAITGVPPGGELNRLLDSKGRQIVPPDEGVVMSAKLAEVLGARLGDEVQIEVLEGQRAVRTAPITGLIEDYAGVAAYMDLRALRRLLREDATVNGAYLTVDAKRWADFMREIKDTPRASIALIKREQLAAFRKTTGQMVNTLRSFYFVLAVIVAFGVVYNSARIALSERNRDLATLRVVGFSQREVAAVLLGELTILVVSALPFGLLFGRGLVNFILSAVSTEAVRMPVRIEPSTYSIALVVVLGAAVASFWVVSRMLRKLDLVGVLKARD
jgi:putative ABC transport system permease protein